MNFASDQQAYRRLYILQCLEAAAQYRANLLLLRKFCDSMGIVASSDRIAADMAWLNEQGLIELEKTGPVAVGVLTARGLDVATGRVEVPGVHRPELV